MSEPADSTKAAKRELRRRLRDARRNSTPEERAARAAAMTDQLSSLVSDRGARSVSAYLSLPDEPDTRGFLAVARLNGIRVLLPIIRDDGLLDWAEHDGSEVTEPTFGMPEPGGEALAPSALEEVELMLIPATAAGRDGSRLGGGKGFFDRTLAAMTEWPAVYALVHDDELFDTVPHAAHDQPVDGVVTPSGIHTFRPRS